MSSGGTGNWRWRLGSNSPPLTFAFATLEVSLNHCFRFFTMSIGCWSWSLGSIRQVQLALCFVLASIWSLHSTFALRCFGHLALCLALSIQNRHCRFHPAIVRKSNPGLLSIFIVLRLKQHPASRAGLNILTMFILKGRSFSRAFVRTAWADRGCTFGTFLATSFPHEWQRVPRLNQFTRSGVECRDTR